jgi:ATP-dependent exoDNAse (exonuclease V) beta subunit
LGAVAPLGIRRPELIVKDVAPDVIASGLAAYNSWREHREQALANGKLAAMEVRTVTQTAKTNDERATDSKLPAVEIVELPHTARRPTGRRFGALVHAVLASVPLDADRSVARRIAKIHGRILGATEQEIESAAEGVGAALEHPLFNQVRAAAQVGRCRREVPVAWRDGGGRLLEGVIDLAFEQAGHWMVIDFKTDEEFRGNEPTYRRQVALYASAIEAASGTAVSALLMRV